MKKRIFKEGIGSPFQDTFPKRVCEHRGLVYETALSFTLNKAKYVDYKPSLKVLFRVNSSMNSSTGHFYLLETLKLIMPSGPNLFHKCYG